MKHGDDLPANRWPTARILARWMARPSFAAAMSDVTAALRVRSNVQRRFVAAGAMGQLLNVLNAGVRSNPNGAKLSELLHVIEATR